MSPLGRQNIQKDASDLRVLMNLTGGSTGSFEFRYRLSAATIVGATSATLNIPYPVATGYQTWMVVDPMTVECEVRRITEVSGSTYSFAALAYAHAASDLVWFIDVPWLPLPWFGAKADAGVTDNITAIDRALVQASTSGGGAAKVIVTPGIFDTSGSVLVPRGVELYALTPIGATGEISRCCIRAMSGFPGSTPLIQLGTTGSYQHGLRLSGLLIDCAQRASIGVYTEVAAEHSKVGNCWIIDATSKGLFFDSSPTGRYASNNFIEKLTVTFPNAAGTEIGVHIIGGASPSGNFSNQHGGSNITINASTAINAGILLENYAGGMWDRVHCEWCTDGIRVNSGRSITLSNIYGVNTTDVIDIANEPAIDAINIISAFRSGGTNIINDHLNNKAITTTRVASYQIGEIYQGGILHNPPWVIRQAFMKNIADTEPPVPELVFTITTTDETGSNDSGAYACFVKAVITQPQASGTGTPVASKAFMATFTRAMGASGFGSNSAVSEIVETASAANLPATRDIGAVTMTVAEIDEYNVGVYFTCDMTGTSATNYEIMGEVELIWTNFMTSPTIA